MAASLVNVRSATAVSSVLVGYGLVETYGSTAALADVDVEVGERDSPATMGTSGSGKSTLLHTLVGIVRRDGGQFPQQVLSGA